MNHALRPLITVSLILLLSACASRAPLQAAVPARSRPAPLLLISIDGFRPDYLKRHLTPNLATLARTGVRATAMRPSFPTLTFPNHYTLVTGLYPDHSGIVNNTMEDPRLGRFSLRDREAVGNGKWWSEAEPIWVTADKQGLKTATMFWPGSEARIHGYRPDHWRAFDARVTPNARVDTILHWLDLPQPQRPSFLTLYFDQVDDQAHEHGPGSAQVDHAMREVDDAIGRLLTGLKQRDLYRHVNIIVVSDHGMAATGPSRRVMLDSLIDMRDVHVVSLGVLAGLKPQPGHAAAIDEALLGPHPHMRCWGRQNIPPRLHYGTNPRVPAIVCLAKDGWTLTTHARADKYTHPLLGEHGYDNADPKMGAFFVAHGPAFRAGVVVPEFPNVDVYPLMSHLLGIHARRSDGDYAAVKSMLKPASR